MEWIRGPTIGRGSTAIVSLATAVPSGEFLAVKSAELSCSVFLQREQSFLSKLSCPRLVKYVGFNVTDENNKPVYNLCMEYVAGGTLSDAIKNNGGRLEEAVIRTYTRQILQGLNYLHMNRLAHCDIKSQNVLIGEDGAKITDLGCAKLVPEVCGNKGGATSAFSGTPAFMAPEVARGEEQGFAADVWAVGCTVIEMATGTNSWAELQDPVSALYRIGFSADLPEIPSWLSEKAKDFLSKCLKRDPKERWTAKGLLEHPFLDETEPHLKEVKMSSPCTVLDQGFWDSMEIMGTPLNLTEKGCSSKSPAEMIKNLIGSSSSALSSLPNWTSDDDWVTVRSNGNRHIKACYGEEEDDETLSDEPSSVASGTVMDSSDEQLQNLIFNEQDMFLEYSVENNSNFHSMSASRGYLLSYESVVDSSAAKTINFNTDNKNSASLLSQFSDSINGKLFHFTFLGMLNFHHMTGNA